MRVLVAYNPVSGRGVANKLAGDISASLLAANCDVELLPTEAGSPRDWLEPRLKQIDRVVAVGGDGTLRSVASCLVGTGIPVYHAASGTENLFAKSMRMSNEPKEVTNTILNGDISRIDTASANSEFLLLMASVGFDADVVADLSKNRGKSITHMSYLMPCIRRFIDFSVPEISIKVDDVQVLEKQKGWVVVANSPAYARGLNPARNASMTDGRLDLVFLPIHSRRSLISWIFRVKRGAHLHHDNSVELRGHTIEIKPSEPACWQLDGDAPEGEITEKLEIVSQPTSLTIIRN
ncbi:MAG: diacylglycerol kinase family protein [Phycisphaerales bacterium]|jgi:diacylglycerol kinase family enzyme|nr:diacylglycerol kinase family protein [Phycisphaerales bacterium]